MVVGMPLESAERFGDEGEERECVVGIAELGLLRFTEIVVHTSPPNWVFVLDSYYSVCCNEGRASRTTHSLLGLVTQTLMKMKVQR
ncbi:hypothetical protein RchiOBHm_Chr5g0063001 [Rosa chinensis]|uniref:Uncharacterized protein n=1 Tax=Rosa chinensis TaxID=74649 RepID=A0A2P6QIA7_ROSCH|nr:hypothetical protein RchiOBHm_Chr5g0063001 [Rosa chinensis]